jgi:lipopolysaccharide exporter
VAVLLGQKWFSAIPLMQILAFNGALLLFQSSMCTVLFGRGFPARVTFSNAAYTVLLVTLLSAFLVYRQDLGVVGAAYAALITSIVSTPLYLYQMWRCLGVPPSLFLRSIRRPAVAAFTLILVVSWVLPAYEPAMGIFMTLVWLVVGVVLALTIYIVTIIAAWRLAGRPAGAEQMATDFLRAQLAKRLGGRFAANKVALNHEEGSDR